jgi:hypothetical protein
VSPPGGPAPRYGPRQQPPPPPAGRRLPPPASGRRRRYAWILTLSWALTPSGTTWSTQTFRGSFTPVPSDTSTSVLTGVYDSTVKNCTPPPAAGSPAVLFWDLRPEELT